VCDNDDQDSLQYFYGEGEMACRVDLCDSCHHYIKTIDVRPVEAPDPILEDLATLHLDVVAGEKEYSRVVLNSWVD
jgi:FdhE protein